jgi:phospholipase C
MIRPFASRLPSLFLAVLPCLAAGCAARSGATQSSAAVTGDPGDDGDGGAAANAPDGGPNDDGAAPPSGSLTEIQHIVVIYLENHSFDSLLGSWPGAEGLANANVPQVDPTGTPYVTLPQYGPTPASVSSLAGSSIPNGPFDLTQYLQESNFTNDLLHRFYQEQMQINGGLMDSYVLYNDESAGQSMGYWPTMSLPVPQWMQANASKVTVCDHFFHAAFGGSFLNHFWLIGAASPVYPNYPAAAGAAQPDDGGVLPGTPDTTSIPANAVINTGIKDGELTPDGYAVNTSYSVNEPHPASFDAPGAATAPLIPQQTYATIGDLLDGASVPWVWYAGGWNAALAAAGIPSLETPSGPGTAPAADGIGAYEFQFHHQPFTYFANWGGTANAGGVGKNPPNGKWAMNHNLQDEQDFVAAAAAGTLPAVSFVKPLYDEHPNYTTEADSQNHTVQLINAVMNGPNAGDSVVIVTYDENGGFFDHVAPPVIDSWGPGTRIPAIVISNYAKGGIDSTTYDTTAILKLIELRFGLPSLTSRDGAQNDLSAGALAL